MIAQLSWELEQWERLWCLLGRFLLSSFARLNGIAVLAGLWCHFSGDFAMVA